VRRRRIVAHRGQAVLQAASIERATIGCGRCGCSSLAATLVG
jgi:hypothetical protein